MVLQNFFLGSRHLQQLKEEYGVEPWQFEQHQGEGVFIPAGCPHQVPCSTHLSFQVYLSHNMTAPGAKYLHTCNTQIICASENVVTTVLSLPW